MKATAETLTLYQLTTQHTSVLVPATLNFGTVPISLDVPRVIGFCPTVDVRINFGASVAASQPSATSAIIPAGTITQIEIPRCSGHLGFIPVGTGAGTISIYGHAATPATGPLV